MASSTSLLSAFEALRMPSLAEVQRLCQKALEEVEHGAPDAGATLLSLALTEIKKQSGTRPTTPASNAVELASVQTHNQELFAALSEARAEIERLRIRAKKMESAIRWANGEGDSNFGDGIPHPLGSKPYWWRKESMLRAGLAAVKVLGNR